MRKGLALGGYRAEYLRQAMLVRLYKDGLLVDPVMVQSVGISPWVELTLDYTPPFSLELQ